MPDTDFTVEHHGSLALLQPLTAWANEWVAENLGDDVMTWGGGVVIEPRYLNPIVDGILADGGEVQ